MNTGHIYMEQRLTAMKLRTCLGWALDLEDDVSGSMRRLFYTPAAFPFRYQSAPFSFTDICYSPFPLSETGPGSRLEVLRTQLPVIKKTKKEQKKTRYGFPISHQVNMNAQREWRGSQPMMPFKRRPFSLRGYIFRSSDCRNIQVITRACALLSSTSENCPFTVTQTR